MIKGIFVSSVLLLLFSCGGVKGKKLTSEVWEQIKSGRELRGEQQAYLNAFIFTKAMEDSVLKMNKPFELDISVGEAINEGKLLTIAYQKSLLRKPSSVTTKPADSPPGRVTK